MALRWPGGSVLRAGPFPIAGDMLHIGQSEKSCLRTVLVGAMGARDACPLLAR